MERGIVEAARVSGVNLNPESLSEAGKLGGLIFGRWSPIKKHDHAVYHALGCLYMGHHYDQSHSR